MDDQETETYLTVGFDWQLQLAEVEQAFAEGALTIDELNEELAKIWPNAVKIRNWCVERARTDARAAMLCSKLAGCAGNLLEMVKGRATLIEWREDAVDAIAYTLPRGVLPQEYQDDMVHDLMGHLTYLGYLHMANNNMGRAREVLLRTIREGETYNTHFADKVAYLHLAMVDIREGRGEEAEANLRETLALADDEDISTAAAAHNLLGVIASSRDDSEMAAQEYEHAADCYASIGQPSGEGTARANLSGILLDLGRREEAEHHLQIAEAIAKRLDSPSHRGLNAVNRARVLIADGCMDSVQILGQLDAARNDFSYIGDIPQIRHVEGLIETLLRSALNGDANPLNPSQRSFALRRLGEIASNRKDWPAQIEWMIQLLADAHAHQDAEDELLAYGQIGHAHLLQGHYEQAASHLESALIVLSRFANRAPLSKAECEIRLSLGQARRHLGQPEEGESQYAQAQRLAELLNDEEALVRAVGNRALLNVDMCRFEPAIAALSKLVVKFTESNDYRLGAHARFNLAFALWRSGDTSQAQAEAHVALDILERIGDESAEEVRRQMESWTQLINPNLRET